MPLVRVLTYNIRMGGRGGDLLDELVRAVAPDVVLVNEAPKTPLLWRRQVRGLAQRWGMRHVAGGRDAGSNMVAAVPGIDVEEAAATTLPQPPFRPRRGIATAQLRVRGRLLGVVACHLSLDGERRGAEVLQVVAAAGRLRGPVVVGGDLNERPRGPSWRRLLDAGYVDHGSADWPTYPAAAPTKRIDALLVGAGTRVTYHGSPGVDETLQARASDHRPVLAVIEI